MDYITKGDMGIPVLTTDQMREVDRLMVEKYGIQLIQMMENAGSGLAELSRRLLGGTVLGKNVAVVAGRGNNGGGGLTAARRLHNWGAQVSVFIISEEFTEVPKVQFDILSKLSLNIISGKKIARQPAGTDRDLLIDAIIGYGLHGQPLGLAAKVIKVINKLDCPIISLDVPSGLNADNGDVKDPCVRADATLTLALPKTGLVTSRARTVVGDLYLADISVPRELYEEMGIKVEPIFSGNKLIKLRI